MAGVSSPVPCTAPVPSVPGDSLANSSVTFDSKESSVAAFRLTLMVYHT